MTHTNKPCPACNGTGTVIEMGVPGECPMCDEPESANEWEQMSSVEKDDYIGIIPRKGEYE